MATAFRIHEDIDSVLDAVQKKDHHRKNTNIIAGKIDSKFEKQPLRSTFAVLSNVNNDNGRNVAAATAHAQKTVRGHAQQQSTTFFCTCPTFFPLSKFLFRIFY